MVAMNEFASGMGVLIVLSFYAVMWQELSCRMKVWLWLGDRMLPLNL
jgi:hypothetical protein